jgi:hypothetical protein
LRTVGHRRQERSLEGHPPARHPLGEDLSRDELEDEVLGRGEISRVINRRDGGTVDSGEQTRLAIEAGVPGGITREPLRQDLDGGIAAETDAPRR